MIAPFVTLVALTPSDLHTLLEIKTLNTHHPDDDHGHHVSHLKKPNVLPGVAARFSAVIGGAEVDPRMKFYMLDAGVGEVAPHVDQDFEYNGKRACHSLLIHLNDHYTGGETMFGDKEAPHVPVGAGLIFPHSLLHSGRKVLTGTKYILKTDILL